MESLGLAVGQVWSLAASGELRSVPGSWPPRFHRADVVSYAERTGAGKQVSLPEGPRPPDEDPAGRDSWLELTAGSSGTLSVSDAAALMVISPAALLRSISNGDLKAVGSPPRLRHRDLADFVERCRIKPGQLGHLDANADRRAADRDPPLTTAGRPDRRYGRR